MQWDSLDRNIDSQKDGQLLYRLDEPDATKDVAAGLEDQNKEEVENGVDEEAVNGKIDPGN